VTTNLSTKDLSDETATGGGPPTHRARWQSPWLVGLTALVVLNLLYALPRYLQFDPNLSRNPILPDYPMQFPLMVAHLLTGNIAMVTVFLQVVPWVRRHHPRTHRISGRMYVFAGAIPSALLGLYLIPALPTPTGQIGLAVEATLWITTTVLGYWHARSGRYAKHRQWMVYSFALALGTTWSRVLYVAMIAIPGFTIGDNAYLEITSWLGWTINLLIAHWWLERRRPAPVIR
jgi:hypothetical protein